MAHLDDVVAPVTTYPRIHTAIIRAGSTAARDPNGAAVTEFGRRLESREGLQAGYGTRGGVGAYSVSVDHHRDSDFPLYASGASLQREM